MRNHFKSYQFILILFLLFSCREEYEIKPATYTLLLTGEESKSWRQASFTFIFDDEEVGEMDANQIYGIPSCALDDIYTFIREGKELQVYNGAQKCDPASEDLLFITRWDIVNANASLFIGGGEPFILSKLTDDALVYGFRDTLVLEVAEKTFWEFPGLAQWEYKPINE